MKFTKLSLVAALAVSAAFAGGDIAPVEPVVETPAIKAEACNSDTTINSKAVAYYYTTDTTPNDIFSKENSQLGTAVTFDVSHKLFDGITANFSAVGYANLLDDEGRGNSGYMENSQTGAFINVANITAKFGDTTLILGRQLLSSPMVGGFDWLLAPGAFEAYTIANNSIENLTLVGTYLRTWRPNNSGNTWVNLNSDKTPGIVDENNYAFGAAYDNKTISGNLWYYNVDSGAAAGNVDYYTQVYVDGGYNFGIAKVEAQYANTDYNTADSSTAYGVKVSGSVANFDLYAAYNRIQDNQTGYVGVDSLYTSSWNTFVSHSWNGEDLDAFKIGASTKFAGLSAELSYADYDNGNETDLILGYDVTDCINVGTVYTNTKPNVSHADDVNALEVFATYKF